MAPLFPILVLLLAAIALVIVAQRLRLPYPIILVAFGVGLGVLVELTPGLGLPGAAESFLTPSFFFDFLLPPIVFEAALHLDFRHLRKRLPMVLYLALIGVVFTTLFTAGIVAEVGALSIGAALVLAAILAPTDPVVVTGLFRRLRAPKELRTIVESESLFNDAVGVTLFLVFLTLVQTGNLAWGVGLVQFAWQVGGGLAIGLLAAGGVYLVHRKLDDPTVETALTVLLAFGTSILANHLVIDGVGASGIVATATAGIAVGTYVMPRAMNTATREAVYTFWKVVVYVVTSLVFISIGLLIPVSGLLPYLVIILLVFGLLFLGRTAFVFAHRPLSILVRRRSAVLPRSWYGAISLAGVRGAIPMVLALSLLAANPNPSPEVRTIVSVVLGVALISIVVNNLTAEWFVKRRFGAGPTSGLAGDPASSDSRAASHGTNVG
jgi:CPA1 family monovalent cation:H+ antiporter